MLVSIKCEYLLVRGIVAVIAMTSGMFAPGVAVGGNDELVARAIACGEFGRAEREIRTTPSPSARDQLWGQLALAQAQQGSVDGASYSTQQISNSSLRLRTWDAIHAYNSYASSDRRAGGQHADASRGGGSQADFGPLLDLIETTVSPETWEAVGGPGTMDGFEGGVFVDAAGTLQRLQRTGRTHVAANDEFHPVRGDAGHVSGNKYVATESALRKISLRRLERHLEYCLASGKPLDEVAANLAGLTRVQYILVYPATDDIVLAGPAGRWRTGVDGRTVHVNTGEPTLRIDDLIVVLHNALHGDGAFGCSITPRRENLARAQAFLAQSAKSPLSPGKGARDRWLTQLRDHVGVQDITVYGIPQDTRTSRTLVEADYHMKLIGMGLEPGGLGVTSYLESLQSQPDNVPTTMDVLRWWFTLNYDAVLVANDRLSWKLVGPGARVQSENEMLAQNGQRVPTGRATEHNLAFTESFTAHFAELEKSYPVYAELRNIFDLAVVASLVRDQGLLEAVNWSPGLLADATSHFVPRDHPPTQVLSVVNHCNLENDKRFVAGVSGGVTVRPRQYLKGSMLQADRYRLAEEHAANPPGDSLDYRAWWWD
ncbi:MAG: DUF1598 domain-containing protein [Pirellulaceae bacterium]|nr:DUF1598 domain-containing protein [Planctomycetales bacterium]